MADFSFFHDFPLRPGKAFMRGDGFDAYEVMEFPPVNICEDERHIYVHALLPGVALDNVSILVKGAELVLKGSVESVTGHFLRKERHCGAFCRTLPLPCPALVEHMATELADGVLQVTLVKKSQKAQNKKPKSSV